MSKPIVVTVCMARSSESREPFSAHIRGTHVPVEEPSTASISECTAKSDFVRSDVIR
jgi:hypothetical protein